MSLEPRMVLNGMDEHARRQRRKDELAAKVEELGLFGKIKNLVTGKGFQDDVHPRGSDGRFAKKGSLGKGFDKIGTAVQIVKGKKESQEAFQKRLAAYNADQDQWLKEATGQWQHDVSGAQAAFDAADKAASAAYKLPQSSTGTIAQMDASLQKKTAAIAAAEKTKEDAFLRLNDLKQSKPDLKDYPKARGDKFLSK